MDRNRQLLRVLRILHDLLVSGGGFTIRELAIKHHVHPKTIRRDLKAISASPFGLATIPGNEEREFRLLKNFRLTDKS